MQRVIFYLIVLITSAVFGQSEEEQKAKATIDTFFEGFHKGDTVLMRSVMSDKVIMQTAFRNKEGKDILVDDSPGNVLKAIATRTVDQKWEERLLSYNIQIDGNMANVWTPYEFWYNDEFHHCGVNSFQLFKNGDAWEIIYMIDTRRRASCKVN
ncbi:nuclear transport factor 2 family protein [Seonamhaeicola sp.]|uniref:nuclear transport factor 2 family protein n=1 Tax=Seonamhaeicola sp. TaxID=1912245 RepID=UPI00262781BB|nr:nuclear transport factor 2 family protein [Seonamhaeicola sp.]